MHFTSNGDWNTMWVSSYRGFLQFYFTTDEFESNNFSSALIVKSQVGCLTLELTIKEYFFLVRVVSSEIQETIRIGKEMSLYLYVHVCTNMEFVHVKMNQFQSKLNAGFSI